MGFFRKYDFFFKIICFKFSFNLSSELPSIQVLKTYECAVIIEERQIRKITAFKMYLSVKYTTRLSVSVYSSLQTPKKCVAMYERVLDNR